MKKGSTFFGKKIKTTTAQTTTIPKTITALLTMTIIMLTGITTTTTSVWATTTGVAAAPIENGQGPQEPAQPSVLPVSLAEPVQQEENQTGAAGGGGTDTQGDEGLAEEAQVGTAEENATTTSPPIESSVLEKPLVPSPLNQTETVEPSENITTTAAANATNATAANATNTTRLSGQIVFEKAPSGDDPYNTEIYIMNADNGNEQTRLTRLTDTNGSASSPSLSPDGEKIAF